MLHRSYKISSPLHPLRHPPQIIYRLIYNPLIPAPSPCLAAADLHILLSALTSRRQFQPSLEERLQSAQTAQDIDETEQLSSVRIAREGREKGIVERDELG